MRDYSQFASTFWTGETGKILRKHPCAQRLAAYLLTSPHANVIGLYYLPLLYASHETGMSIAEIEEAFGVLSGPDADFAFYDPTTEHVFVANMARIQLNLGDKPLDDKDNRLKGARKAAEAAKRSPLYPMFVERWGWYIGLQAPSKGVRRGSEGGYRPPSKGQPTASEEQKQIQDQIQEQDQEQKQGEAPPGGTLGSTPESGGLPPWQETEPENSQDWTAEIQHRVFVAAFERKKRTLPSMGGKHVGRFHAKVLRTAELQIRDPRELFVETLEAWLSGPLNPEELRYPYACFDAAWGDLTAHGARASPSQAAPRPTRPGRMERAPATTGKDFDDAPPIDEQLARLRRT